MHLVPLAESDDTGGTDAEEGDAGDDHGDDKDSVQQRLDFMNVQWSGSLRSLTLRGLLFHFWLVR